MLKVRSITSLIIVCAGFLVILIIQSCNQGKNKEVNTADTMAFRNHQLSIDDRVNDLISRLTLEEKASQMVYNSVAIERLGIPEYNWWSEALHGVARSAKATVFPQAIGLAATFDENLIYRISSAISDEARAIYNAAVAENDRGQYKGLTFWSPNVNIFRDPRWGRGHETYGEDPYLSGLLGSAFVKGLQGDHSKYLKAAACAKHYVVHSGPEALRHEFNAIANQKDLYETYLPAFHTLVDAGVETIMCAYNRTNNKPCCGSDELLINILRHDWGFKGHIVSDCWALIDFHENHKYTLTQEESAALAVKNSVNLNCGIVYHAIPNAVKQGLLTEQEVDEALKPLLKTRFKLGLFDPPGSTPFDDITTDVIHSKMHKDLALEAAQKSMVLLKNKNNVLPLDKNYNSIFITGPNAGNVDVLLGNYYGVNSNMVTILEGIVSKVGPHTAVRYKYGVMLNNENANPRDWSTGNAKYADATIAVFGIAPLLEGEEGEAIASAYGGDRNNISLPENQIHYIKQLRESAGDKPIILVLTGGSAIAIPEVENLVDAILFAWYPGEQGGQAVGDVIFGDAVPSGRLPVTIPKSISQLPDYENYDMTNRTYKYMEEDPLYPFGFGLSYTTFEYSDLKLNKTTIKPGDEITAEVLVKNTGSITGEEVVQLYITDMEASFRVPKYSLIGINKVELNSGESKLVSFTITEKMMSSINMNGEVVIEPGQIKITIGGSLPGIRSTELGAANSIDKVLTIK
ncbi:glycoside hydrolase family 3 C-terminal domain-containing protein [Bacteroidota bacterium]